MKISEMIRHLLTIVLIYLAYQETGKWTATVLALIFIDSEITSHIIKRKINDKNR